MGKSWRWVVRIDCGLAELLPNLGGFSRSMQAHTGLTTLRAGWVALETASKPAGTQLTPTLSMWH